MKDGKPKLIPRLSFLSSYSFCFCVLSFPQTRRKNNMEIDKINFLFVRKKGRENFISKI
jgi:hypothetical protein